MFLTRLLAALAVTAFSLSLSFADDTTMVKGDVYKCTAADGTISYLETKPTTGCVTVEVVRINSGKGTPGAHQASKDTDNDAATKAQDKRDIDERKGKANEACEIRKTNLNILKSSTAVTMKDADGKSKPLSPEEIQQQIRDAEQYLKDFCSQPQ